MIMKKYVLLTFIMSVLFVGVSAQSAYETTEKWEKTNGPCVAIKVNSSPDDAIKTLEDLFKKDGLKGKKSKRTLKYEKTAFPTISTDYINLYAKAEQINKDKENPVTAVYIFVSKGIADDFISSSNDRALINNLKVYLDQKYVQEIYTNFIAAKKEAKNKEIKDTSSAITGLEKTVDKKNKDIEKLEKDIEKAKSDIEKNKSDIEKAKNDMKVQNDLLKRQQKELEEIK